MKVRRYGEAIIGGMVVMGRNRTSYQALLLGDRQDAGLSYVGQTAFGFQSEAKNLLAR